MDTRFGKYDGPLAALGEHWMMDGDFGDHEFSDSDIGEGSILWLGPVTLSYRDAEYLRNEHECTSEELDLLARELELAQSVSYAWDSQGFQYGSALDLEHTVDAVDSIERLNDEYAGDENR